MTNLLICNTLLLDRIEGIGWTHGGQLDRFGGGRQGGAHLSTERDEIDTYQKVIKAAGIKPE